jgi:hypothetical protein
MEGQADHNLIRFDFLIEKATMGEAEEEKGRQ